MPNNTTKSLLTPNAPHLLFSPTKNELKHSAMATFCREMALKYALKNSDYHTVYEWSVASPADYWKEILYAGKIVHSGQFSAAMVGDNFFDTDWFPGLTFNYAENMLSRSDASSIALISTNELEPARQRTFGELKSALKKMVGYYQSMGLRKGDRIAAIVPNADIAIICSLAASAMGVIWASASPDLGKEGLLDRFVQIRPKALISIDGYSYNGKAYAVREKITAVRQTLDTVERHIEFSIAGLPPGESTADTLFDVEDIMRLPDPEHFQFERFPFSHPLYILFSSGTTGVPKCITHSHGGVLFQHTGELLLHCDIGSGDRLLFYTTCGWMMWNWMISALGRGATVIAYDGSPGFRHGHYLWELADRLCATHVGMGAKYVSACAQSKTPSPVYGFSALRTVFTTGSPLTDDLFDFLDAFTQSAVRIASISGGTDIVACFVGGNPILPVYRGEIQCRLLGMDVRVFSENGTAIMDEKGELVCLKAFPSAPVCFQNDPDNTKYKRAYFDVFPNIWTHGDFIGINSKTGGIVIYGRSDTTLNPGGVRIGAAEIYRYTEDMACVSDSIVIGHQTDDDERMILFVVMADGYVFDEAIDRSIRWTIRTRATPRHVPEKIFPVRDIPRTLNGKKMEKTLKNIFAGQPNTNLSAMANVECLDEYKRIKTRHFP